MLRTLTSAETRVARVTLDRWQRGLVRVAPACPSPVIVEGRLRLTQTQGVFLLYAIVLAASLLLGCLEWLQSSALHCGMNT